MKEAASALEDHLTKLMHGFMQAEKSEQIQRQQIWRGIEWIFDSQIKLSSLREAQQELGWRVRSCLAR